MVLPTSPPGYPSLPTHLDSAGPSVACDVEQGWCGGFGNPSRPPVVCWWGLGYLTPPLPTWGVVCCAVVVGCGFQVYCLTLFPPPCGVAVGVGFRVCTRARLWCGGGFWAVKTPPLPPCGVVWCAAVVGCGFQV